MAKYGKTSKARLNTCHPDLIKICTIVVSIMDNSVTEGARPDEKQMEYFLAGKSKLDGVNKRSKHQVTKEEPLSKAVDIAPYPIDYSDGLKARARFYMLAGYMFAVSEMLLASGEITHKLRWGGDWDSDKDFSDQSFDDLPHFELIKA
jgi:peptidoglycan L-alanyl-D-glutamate endopeptidase CwlK